MTNRLKTAKTSKSTSKKRSRKCSTKRTKGVYAQQLKDQKGAVKEEDPEAYHWIEDDILHTFVHDICAGRFNTLQEVTRVAEQLKTEILDTDRALWFA